MVGRALAVLVHLAVCRAGVGDVAVRFVRDNGDVIATRAYSRNWAIFDVSGRHGADAGECEEPLVELRCAPEVFETAARLFDAPLGDPVEADIVFSVLDFAETLEIPVGDRRTKLYRNIARATLGSESLRREVERRRGHAGTKTYLLQLLLELASAHGIGVEVERGKATLCPASTCPLECKDITGEIDEIGISKKVMRGEVRHKVLHFLEWAADIMNLQGLCLSGCMLDTDAVERVGAMKSLRRLYMHKCGLRAGALKHLQGLENLEELDVSWNVLSKDDLDAIGKIVSLIRLDIQHCDRRAGIIHNLRGLERLQQRAGVIRISSLRELSRLEELKVSFNTLDEADFLQVGKLNSLKKLSISHYRRIGSESLINLKGLRNLVELEVRGKDLNERDICGVWNMKSLERLALWGCWLEKECLGYLRDIEGLRVLDVSWTRSKLRSRDLLGIGAMKKLEKLLLHNNCRIETGSLKHVEGMDGLRELYVSLNTLNADDLSGIGGAQGLVKLSLCGCKIVAGGLSSLLKLKNLQVLDIRGLKVKGFESELADLLYKLQRPMGNVEVVAGAL